MDLISGGINKALEVLSNAPTVGAQKSHIDWLKDQLLAAEKKLLDLEAENTSLLRENRELRKLNESLQETKEYLDLGMCLLKKNPDGGYFETPLCPSCKKPLSKFATGQLVCGTCAILLNRGDVMHAVRNALSS